MLVQISKEDITTIFRIIDKYDVNDDEIDAIERLTDYDMNREIQENKLTFQQIKKLEKLEDLLYEALQTYIKKNADYGDSFSKSYKEFGITAPVVRMNDKMERLKSLTKADAKVKDESIRDTLIDLANYAMMTVIELEEEEEKIKECEDLITERLEVRGQKIGRVDLGAINDTMQKLNHINGLTNSIGDKGPVGEPAMVLDKNGKPITLKEVKTGLKTGCYRGYQIYIRHIRDVLTLQFPSGYYCGYVALPFTHPFYGEDYHDLDELEVHGGLTCSGYLDFSDSYLLGFDCGHGGDDIKVQNEDYTLAECKKLVDQLIKVYGKEIDKRDI